MAETLLDFEKGVITLRNQNQISEPEIENEIDTEESDYDYEDWIWEGASEYRNRAVRDMCYASASEISDCRYDELGEVMEYLAEDNGDTTEVTPSDIYIYLYDRGEDLRDYDDLDRLVQYVADVSYRDCVWEDKDAIMRYRAFDYWEDEYGFYIPRELASEIECNDWGGASYLSDADDFVNDWLDDHNGIMDFQP